MEDKMAEKRMKIEKGYSRDTYNISKAGSYEVTPIS